MDPFILLSCYPIPALNSSYVSPRRYVVYSREGIVHCKGLFYKTNIVSTKPLRDSPRWMPVAV